MHRNIVNGFLVVHGCIHKLEHECDVLNIELGDCEIECENEIVWRCPYLHLKITHLNANEIRIMELDNDI